jgi:hypothetical protein
MKDFYIPNILSIEALQTTYKSAVFIIIFKHYRLEVSNKVLLVILTLYRDISLVNAMLGFIAHYFVIFLISIKHTIYSDYS